MGWRPNDLREATMAEFVHFYKGWTKQQADENEREWERARLQVATQINTHVKKENQIKPEDIIELSFDKIRRQERSEWIKNNAPTEKDKNWMRRKGLIK